MAALQPDLPATDLRAALLENALPASLPVGSGYLYALGSVLSAATAASLQEGQRPQVRILEAQRSGAGRRATTTAQVAVLGASEAIRDFQVTIDGRRAAVLRKRRSPFTVRVRGRSGARLQVLARNARGRTLARGAHPISAVRRGKRDIRSGGDVTGGTVELR
jgi:hypothetical protein